LLPTLQLRALGLFGMACGCAAVFLSEWGVMGVPGLAWKALAALAILSLIGMRSMPRQTVDDQELRSRVGDPAVNRLVLLRRAAIIVLILAILPAVAVAPLISDVLARRSVLTGCAAILVGALATFAFVEVQFRSLVHEAGIPTKVN